MDWRAYLEDPALRSFAAVTEDRWTILVRRGYESWAIVAAAGGAAVRGRTGSGRAQHPVVELSGKGEAVLRHYHRGGMMRHLNRDRYLSGHRAFDELRATERARAAGVRVPEVIAAAERRRGVGYQAFIATRWLPDVVGIDQWLAERSGGEAGAALRLAGAQIARMHNAGIAHPDLNLRNLLVRANDGAFLSVYLIDFDRARLQRGGVRRGRRGADLKRLARSAGKLQTPLGHAGWSALRDGYGAGWPLESFPSA